MDTRVLGIGARPVAHCCISSLEWLVFVLCFSNNAQDSLQRGGEPACVRARANEQHRSLQGTSEDPFLSICPAALSFYENVDITAIAFQSRTI